jgi:signal transduction histidine kinase
MRIRTRLSLWYAAVMLASLSLMGALSYYQFVRQRSGEPGQQESLSGRGDQGRLPQRDERPDAARKSEPRAERPVGGGRRHGLFAEVMTILGRVGIPAMVMAVAGGWWLMRRSLAPVEALTRAVERTHERNLRQQLPRSGNGDELDRLTEVFNAMTARLDQSFQEIREFTLHASHELKTPLTVMQGEIETACREESLTDVQRDRLLSQLDEVQRLAKIVDGLSLLTKADAGQVSLARDPVQLDELLREAFEDMQHLGQSENLAVTLTACEPVVVHGDRHRLRQLLLNLADNAVKYNEPHGRATLSLRRVGPEAELVFTNTGPGLPRDQQSRVFERFFRGDASHSSAVEGSGLGLSIVEWIARAHGGSVLFESGAGTLTTVTVRLPVV